MPKQEFFISPDAPWLAPLAGWSDLPFRLLCREEGAKVTCTEMISAKGLAYGGKNTRDLLASCPTDKPVVAQIFGAEHDFMEKGISILQEQGFQYFDVNVGCSVAKVVKTGAGAAMLRDIPNLLKVAEHVIRQVHNPAQNTMHGANLDFAQSTVQETTEDINSSFAQNIIFDFTQNFTQGIISDSGQNIPKNIAENSGQNIPKNIHQSYPQSIVESSNQGSIQSINKTIATQDSGKIGFKIRLGYEMGHDVYIDLAKELEKLGADWITLHPRYAKQSFSGVPKYEALTHLKNAVKIPVVASGDLFSAQDGVRVLLETGVDAVMYARGAMANPFIFKEHKALWDYVQKEGMHKIPPIAEILPKSETEMRNDLGRLIERHLKYAKEFNPHRSLLQMRTIVPRYVKRLENAKTLRLSLIACRSHEELDRVLDDFFKNSA